MQKVLLAGCLCALTLPLPIVAQEAEAPTAMPAEEEWPALDLTLFDAVEWALRYNLQVRLNKLAPEQSEAAIDSNRAQFDPTIIFDLPSAFGRNITQGTNQLAGGDVITSETVRGGFTFQDRLEFGTDWSISWTGSRQFSTNTFSNFNPNFSSNLSLQVSQPLLRGFGREVQTAQIVIAKNNYEISNEQFRDQVLTTVRQVYRAYWQLVFSEANVETQQLALDLAQQQLNRNRIQVDIGTLAPIETIQAEQQVASAELAVTQAQQQTDDAEDDLKRLINLESASPMGWNVNLNPTTPPPLENDPIDLVEAVRTAMENDPALRQERLRLDSQSLSLKVASDALRPQLNFTGSVQLSGTGGDFLVRSSGFGSSEISEIQEGGFEDALRAMMSGDFRNWSVGLRLQFPVNNWAAKAQVAQAQIGERQILTRLADREQLLRVNVTKAARQVTSGARQVDQATTALELAQRQLDAEERKFAVGTTTNFEVLRFQRDLATARTQQLQAILNYVNSLADLEQLKGTLLETLGMSMSQAGTPSPIR
jgi:outer membrane protein TolC